MAMPTPTRVKARLALWARLPAVCMETPCPSVVINGGAAATNSRNSTLTLVASDALSGVTQMRFSNTGTSYSTAEAFAPTKAWTLSIGTGALCELLVE